jgi:hypothetical protein
MTVPVGGRRPPGVLGCPSPSPRPGVPGIPRHIHSDPTKELDPFRRAAEMPAHFPAQSCLNFPRLSRWLGIGCSTERRAEKEEPATTLQCRNHTKPRSGMQQEPLRQEPRQPSRSVGCAAKALRPPLGTHPTCPSGFSQNNMKDRVPSVVPTQLPFLSTRSVVWVRAASQPESARAGAGGYSPAACAFWGCESGCHP